MLLCVEPDAKDLGLIRDALTPLGFQIKNITNGEQAIEWGKKHPPELLIVCVEPRKVGYAICNKVKRSPELKDVPLILISAEETQQTFDQHRKLRSHADDYILKPLQKQELINKVKQLVPDATESRDEIILDDSEEISIGDGDIVEERAPSAPMKVNGGPPSGSFQKAPDLDSFDKETEAAFAAIQTPTGDLTGPISGSGSSSGGGWDPDGWSDEATKAGHNPGIIPGGMGAPPPPPRDIIAKPSFGMDGADVPPSPDEVMHPVASNDISVPISIGSDARLKDLQARFHDLESDKHRLESEIEELRARLQAQPISKEKDMLSLREIINRKEKDVLDLRDALDAKERQILDHKDRIRENERARRDLEEKMLGFEKSLVAANERVSALSHDKEKSLERERGLKARLDDALSEIQKAHEEVDNSKRRVQAIEDRSRGELERVRAELEGRIAELEETHRLDVARLADERAAAEAARKNEHLSEVARIEAARVAEVEGVTRKLTDELNGQSERLQAEMAKLRRDNEKALASLKEEQSQQLAAERQAHQAATEAKERDHRGEIQGLRRHLEQELASAEDRRQKELAEAETKKVAELEAAEARRRAELQTRDEEHHALVAEMDRRHFNEKTEMGERHRGEMDQAHARAARAEGDLAARSEELSEAYRKVTAREADLDALRADVRDRDVKLTQTRDRLAELEAKSAELEDQILRAYQKLRSDEKIVEKAKRAMAVALSLLDGGAQPAQQQPATSSAPVATPAPAPARSSEESPT
jgi:CheY-like chemotaxis protein/predicted  nucleic acid-binding Zn-ribbon protein